MIDWILFGIGVALSSQGGGDPPAMAAQAPEANVAEEAAPETVVPETVAPETVAKTEEAAQPAVAMADPAFIAEPQVPSGKFTTAVEVKPILAATRASWVAVRDYGGQDLLYVTHLLSWRCGLHQMRYAVNGGPMQVYDLPPCHVDTATPNAITPEDGLPYLTYAPGEVEFITVELLYDDMTTEKASFMRADVLMP
ncbi:MAG: hypothetical protein RIG84_19865 [Roseovarius sp.]